MQPLEYFLTDSHQYSEENNAIYNFLVKHLENDLVDDISRILQRYSNKNELILLIFNKAYEIIGKIESNACPQIHVDDYFTYTALEIADDFGMPNRRDMEVPKTLAAHAMCIAYGIIGLPYYSIEITNGEGPKVLMTIRHYNHDIGEWGKVVTFQTIFATYADYLFYSNLWGNFRDNRRADESEEDTEDELEDDPQEQEDEEIAPDTPIDEQVILQIGQGQNIREAHITASRVVQCVKDSGHKSKLSNTEWEKLLSNITSISEKSFHQYW